MKAVGGGIGGLIVLILTLLLSGGDPGVIFNDNTNVGINNPGSSYYEGATTPISQEERELADFVSVVLADTEDTWNEIFAAENLITESLHLYYSPAQSNLHADSLNPRLDLFTA